MIKIQNVQETGSGKHVGNNTTMDPLLSALNVDHHGEKKTTQAKLLPCGLIKAYESFYDMMKSLLIDICNKK